MIVDVSKYHGCGNDFIMISDTQAQAIADLADFARSVCDRHTGIGADGMIVVREHPFFMEYYNQDGSRAPMCGNGIRCFARFLFDQGKLTSNVFDVETLAGTKTIEIVHEEPFLVRVNMEKPLDDPQMIAVCSNRPVADYELDVNGENVSIDSLFMSTVHTVVFDEDAMGDIERKGKAVCMHPFFKEQTNVNFVHVTGPDSIEVQTYERGCGVTLACGTGVCASAVVCRRKGLTGSHVDATLRRGTLHIDIDPDETVWMSGPAEKIMEGSFEYSPLQTCGR